MTEKTFSESNALCAGAGMRCAVSVLGGPRQGGSYRLGAADQRGRCYTAAVAAVDSDFLQRTTLSGLFSQASG